MGILQTAKAHEGIVTPEDVAVRTKCDLERAKMFLHRLVERGHTELRATHEGESVYVFPAFLAKTRREDLEPLT